MGGFFSYIKYRKCFDFAYGRGEPGSVDCNRFLDLNLKVLRTSEDQLFCVQDEE